MVEVGQRPSAHVARLPGPNPRGRLSKAYRAFDWQEVRPAQPYCVVVSHAATAARNKSSWRRTGLPASNCGFGSALSINLPVSDHTRYSYDALCPAGETKEDRDGSD